MKFGVVLTGIQLLAYGGLVRLHLQHSTLRAEQTPATLAWYFLAFAAYLATLWWSERQRQISPGLMWGAAILFRLLLLFTTPTLSDDVYRYLWDGYVANQGVSPYAWPIDSPELDYLDIPQRAQANNRWMASPYLPTAQLLFAALTWRLPLKPIFFQIVMVTFDLLSAVLIAKLLKLSKLPDRRLLIYLWHPLVIVEVAHGAHVDAWMVFLILLSLWLTFSPNRAKMSTWLAPLTLALATLTKFLPVLLLPLLFWRWRWGQLVLYGAIILVLLLPFGWQAGWGLRGPLDGTGLFGAIRIYADQWNFNSGLFHWLEIDLLTRWGVIEADRWAKRAVGLALAAVIAAVWFQARHRSGVRSTLRLMATPFMAYLLLTTTIHPWYALILLAFLPFLSPAPAESRQRWLVTMPWFYLSATLPLSYLTYLNPLDFRELEWVRRAEWLPTLGLLFGWVVFSQLIKLTGSKLEEPASSDAERTYM